MPSNSRFAIWSIGMLLIVGSAADVAYATIGAVPEIDGSSLSAGLALLTGAAMIVRSKMRRK